MRWSYLVTRALCTTATVRVAKSVRRGAVAIAGMGIAAVLVTGCRDVGPLETSRFSVERRDQALSIPLDVSPGGKFNANDRYVLALGLDAPSGREAIAQLFGVKPAKLHIRLRVNLVRTDGGWDEHVPFATRAFVNPANPRDTSFRYDGASDQSVISTLYPQGIGRDEAYLEIASFRFPSFGTYRIDVETLEDQPVLRNVRTNIYVTVPFGHPK